MSAVSTYAEALFEAAREREVLEEVLSDLGEFVEALHDSEELRLYFYGGQIPERQKRRALDGLTEGMKISTTNFLTRVWRDGALFGSTPQQAFYVKCDAETNPPDVVEAGQVVVEVGIAPVKPAEFVIFRISQFTGGGEAETAE